MAQVFTWGERKFRWCSACCTSTSRGEQAAGARHRYALGFLGQFAAVSQVELRAQVGGTLTGIFFKDGDIVRKGDVLFTIDARPYEITLAEANAQLEVAAARLELADRQLDRAKDLEQSNAGSVETLTSAYPISGRRALRSKRPKPESAMHSSTSITAASRRRSAAALGRISFLLET